MFKVAFLILVVLSFSSADLLKAERYEPNPGFLGDAFSEKAHQMISSNELELKSRTIRVDAVEVNGVLTELVQINYNIQAKNLTDISDIFIAGEKVEIALDNNALSFDHRYVESSLLASQLQFDIKTQFDSYRSGWELIPINQFSITLKPGMIHHLRINLTSPRPGFLTEWNDGRDRFDGNFTYWVNPALNLDIDLKLAYPTDYTITTSGLAAAIKEDSPIATQHGMLSKKLFSHKQPYGVIGVFIKK